jgi:hypothetical protein
MQPQQHLKVHLQLPAGVSCNLLRWCAAAPAAAFSSFYQGGRSIQTDEVLGMQADAMVTAAPAAALLAVQAVRTMQSGRTQANRDIISFLSAHQ